MIVYYNDYGVVIRCESVSRGVSVLIRLGFKSERELEAEARDAEKEREKIAFKAKASVTFDCPECGKAVRILDRNRHHARHQKQLKKGGKREKCF